MYVTYIQNYNSYDYKSNIKDKIAKHKSNKKRKQNQKANKVGKENNHKKDTQYRNY